MDTADTDDTDRGRIHQRIAEHAREMHSRSGVDAEMVVADMVEAAVADIPGVQYAGITVVRKRSEVRTEAATHRYPVMLDDIQRQYLQGPCLSAQWEQHAIRIPDLAAETRWPEYCRAALEATPIRSIMSLELFNGVDVMGALNLFADDPGVFMGATEELATVFAAHAALAWSSVRKESQLSSALASRDIIGQAKGIIMERYRVDAVRAFELLRYVSQDSNTPLVQIAQRLVSTDFDTL